MTNHNDDNAGTEWANETAEERVFSEETRVFPEHIRIHFEKDPADKLAYILSTLDDCDFSTRDERALIFVFRRLDAEEYAAHVGDKADYYHAGRDSADKIDVATRYADGSIRILFATKAFGMGVDIRNVRHVFHTMPPSSIEDYIQEIGRAGRDGVESHAYLPYSDSDFNDVRSRLVKSQLHWNMVKELREVLEDYRTSLVVSERESFVIPEDLIVKVPALSENLFGKGAAGTRQRMLLHSLEEAERVAVGGFELTHWPISLGSHESKDKNSGRIRNLAKARGATEIESTLISEAELSKELGFSSDSAAREELFRAAKIGAVRIPFDVAIGFTSWATDDKNKYSIDAILEKGRSFLTKIHNEDSDTIDIAYAEIHPQYLTRADEKKMRREGDPVGVRFDERKAAIIRFLRRVDGIRISGNKRVARYRLTTTPTKDKREDSVDWRDILKQLPERSACIVAHLRGENPARTIDQLYKVAEAGLAKMRLKDLELTLNYLAALGIAHLDNELIPVGVRVDIKKDFLEPFDTERDEVAREELYQRNQLRIWRLDALQVLTRIDTGKEAFAKDFFDAKSVSDARQVVLNKAIEVDENLLKQFAAVALEDYYTQLTVEQQNVVRIAQRHNAIVQAGPGTGKTHTLINCVAQRLIASDKIPDGSNPNGPISAQNILVLAYTRAVVEELRDRLRRLLTLLGRNEIPQIHTFHSYALMKLSDVGRRDVKMDEAISEFTRVFTTRSLPNAPAHVFVDEFQDITYERAKMLKSILKPTSLITVIGDPDQSIYEYDKQDKEKRSAEFYFRKFTANFSAQQHFLYTNFRSDQAILGEATKIFPRNLVPGPNAGAGRVIHTSLLTDSLEQIVKHELSSYSQVAVLFRKNPELYDALPNLKAIPGIELRVLGGKGKVVNSREINETLEVLTAKYTDHPVTEELVVSAYAMRRQRTWESRLSRILFDGAALYAHNHPNKRISDFVEWVRGDLAGNHLMYASQQRRADVPRRELTLSTMHRTKGLEFQSVVIAPSDMSLPFKDIVEENKLRYVAVTRAKHSLVLVDGERELALTENRPWEQARGSRRQRFDTIDDEGIGAFRLYEFSHIQDYILKSISEGDQLEIKNDALWHHRQRLCGIAARRDDLKGKDLRGIFVSEVVRMDGFGEEDQFKRLYSDIVQKQGWYYVVNAAGYLA